MTGSGTVKCTYSIGSENSISMGAVTVVNGAWMTPSVNVATGTDAFSMNLNALLLLLMAAIPDLLEC
jgi:hypothetical protein